MKVILIIPFTINPEQFTRQSKLELPDNFVPPLKSTIYTIYGGFVVYKIEIMYEEKIVYIYSE